MFSLDHWGIGKMPWVVRVYLFLFVFLISLLAFTVIRITDVTSATPNILNQLYSFTTDSLKLVLGALLGSLSMAAEKTWGHSVPPEREIQQGSLELKGKPSKTKVN